MQDPLSTVYSLYRPTRGAKITASDVGEPDIARLLGFPPGFPSHQGLGCKIDGDRNQAERELREPVDNTGDNFIETQRASNRWILLGGHMPGGQRASGRGCQGEMNEGLCRQPQPEFGFQSIGQSNV